MRSFRIFLLVSTFGFVSACGGNDAQSNVSNLSADQLMSATKSAKQLCTVLAAIKKAGNTTGTLFYGFPTTQYANLPDGKQYTETLLGSAMTFSDIVCHSEKATASFTQTSINLLKVGTSPENAQRKDNRQVYKYEIYPTKEGTLSFTARNTENSNGVTAPEISGPIEASTSGFSIIVRADDRLTGKKTCVNPLKGEMTGCLADVIAEYKIAEDGVFDYYVAGKVTFIRKNGNLIWPGITIPHKKMGSTNFEKVKLKQKSPFWPF
jgi:hypothetical protein